MKDKAPGQSVKIPITISNTTRKWEAANIDVSLAQANDEYTSVPAKFSMVEGTTRTDKGQLYLVIDSSIGEILKQRKADAEKDIDAIAPCLVTVKLTSTPEGAKAAVSSEITFELVVEKTVTSITLDNSSTPKKDANGMIKIDAPTAPATSSVILEAVVKVHTLPQLLVRKTRK